MRKFNRLNKLLWAIVLLAAACSGAPASPPAVSQAPAAASQAPAGPQTSAAPIRATAAAPLKPVGQQLAFLKAGDVWLYDGPGTQPYPLTMAGDILSYTWAPDGSRVAIFNGKSLCFTQRDGSVRTACLDLGLTEAQTKIERRILLSPDQRWVALWNPANPWDAGALGWMVFALDGSDAMYRIEDPVDWGAGLAPNNPPGGITGQPAFLRDGRLVGSLTHRILNSPDGQHYQLQEFDLAKHSFSPFPAQPPPGFSEGLHLALTPDGQQLANFGAFISSCDSYQTALDIYNLTDNQRRSFKLDGQAVADLSFAPDAQRAVISRVAGCNPPDKTSWSAACGLSAGPEVYAMQAWDLAKDQRTDLLPGLSPAWSPDGAQVAFQSCLAQKTGGGWETTSSGPASIYLMDPAGDKVELISDGSQPSWRP
jgi:dipeptidyl aminopeptidase/acylaminoacyl peptidase